MYSPRMLSLQALIVIAVLLLLEGGARIAYTVYSNPLKQSNWYTYTADLGWDRRPNFDGFDDCGVRRTFDSQGLVSADGARLQQHPVEQFRALFLGDSNVYGYCLETSQTFVEVVNRLLPQSPSINLGTNGYTSYQGYKALLKYGDLLKPSMVFISFNFNDRRFVLQEDQADSDARFQRLYSTRFARYLWENSYLFRFADFLGRRFSAAGAGSLGVIAEVRLDKARPRVDANSYRENLTKMVQWARQREIPVAFILLSDNPNETRMLKEGVQQLSEKNYALAIKYLTFVKDRPHSWFSALASRYLSIAYRETGLPDEAHQALSLKNVLMSAHGGYPIMLDSEYNKIMMEVAKQFGVQLIDAASELNKTPGVYFDFCHFDASGHEIVGRLVKDAIETAKMNLLARKR